MEEQFEEIIEILEQDEGPTTGEKFKAFLKEMFETLIIALVLIIVIEGLSDRVKIEGNSMMPGLHQDNRVIVSKVSYIKSEIERGDIVVFDYPNNPEEEYIKRVIGIAGDKVSISEGEVYLNDVILDEQYVDDYMLGTLNEEVIQEGMIFVMGDNRNHSSDSRYWGALSIDYVIGKAVFIYWPFNEFGIIQRPNIFLND